MFLYWFVCCRRQPQILVLAITFWILIFLDFGQLFGFLSFLAQLLALTYRLPDKILVDFRRDLDLEFSRSNVEFAISQPKMVQLPRNENETHRLNSRPQMWPSGVIAMKQKANRFDLKTSNMTIRFDLGHDLDLEFSRSNMELAISLPKMVPLPRNEKQTHWTLGLKCDQQIWPGRDLDLEFSRSNMKFAISQPKMLRLPQNEKQTYRFEL